MNRTIGFLIILFIILNIPFTINAQEQKIIYVSDVLILTVRKGPAQSFEIFSTIESDEKLILLGEKNGYSQVKLINGDIGWVQTQYLTFKAPDPLIIQGLNKKINKLTAKNKVYLAMVESLKKKNNKNQTRLEKQKRDLATDLSKSLIEKNNYAEKYSILDNKYNALLEESKDVVLTTNKNTKLIKMNKVLVQKLESLESENKTLFKVGMIKWFLAGAGVILLGWIIGRSIAPKGSRSNGLLK